MKRFVAPILAVVFLMGAIAAYMFVPAMNVTGVAGLLSTGSFPSIDQTDLTDTQKRIITVAKAEHTAQPNYLKYSEGNKEPWCADFVSWVMLQSDVPLHNPNSGHWRIPGTLTLRAYYEAQGRFKPISSSYQPKVGDVVLYDGPGWFGQHTNIVLKNQDGQLTTVGGNEVGKIRVQTRQTGTRGIVGYGLLPEEGANS